ncbi:hypothetical protein BDW62DRAFT_62613 [Aspergillus aurantiobrunneus]
MLAALAPMEQVPNPSHYPWTPARPSPLSPRRQSSSATAFTTTTTPSPNQPQFQSPTSIFSFSPSPSPSQIKAETTTTSSRSNTNTHTNPNAISPTPTYASRYKTAISNPLLSHSSKRNFTSSASPRARSVRRNAFLNRVKQDRESGRFEARADQLAYMEDIAEQKEWAEEMRLRAEEIQSRFGLGIDEEEEGEEYEGAHEDEADAQALDCFIEQERREMELLDRMESAGHLPYENEPRQSDGTSSFSDEEYDDIFMDLMDRGPEDMDMSG